MLEQSQLLIEQIVTACSGKKIWVAYSGGVDSHVLLHLLATAQQPHSLEISAIHVDHGLHPDSALWRQHCAKIADQLAVNFHSVKADVVDIADLGMEAAARKARYQAIAQQLSEHDVLLTAQHQHDQAETFLLQLLRGAGTRGLSAMASESYLDKLHIVRPLLAIPQSDIKAYAQHHELEWIDDPSNDDSQWNRNYIRHVLWPDLEQRWPSAAKTISRSAQHCADAEQLMTELAQIDLSSIADSQNMDCLSITKLQVLSTSRQCNVVRHVIRRLALPMPSEVVLQRIFDEVCLAKQDSMPMVTWQGAEVRRYHDTLYFMQPLAWHDASQTIECYSAQDSVLADGKIIQWQSSEQGIKKQILEAGITIAFRQGGEKIQLPGHQYHKSLKQLFQEWSIPPWQRDRIPLVFKGDELIAVLGYAISQSAVADEGDAAYLPLIKES